MGMVAISRAFCSAISDETPRITAQQISPQFTTLISNRCRSAAACSMIFSTASAAGSLLKRASSAQLSTILMAILQVPFPTSLGHEGFHRLGAFQGSAQAADEFGGDGFDEDAFRRAFH